MVTSIKKSNHIQKDKAHTDSNGMDFLGLIAGYAPATDLNIENSKQKQAVHNLAFLLGHSNLYFVTDDIKVNGEPIANSDGIIYTANTIATLVYDERFIPSGIVFFPTKDTQTTPLDPHPHRPKLYYTDPDKLQAFMIGSGQGEIIATDTLDNAGQLFLVMQDGNMKSHTIIAPVDKAHFEPMGVSLARHRPIHAVCNFKQEKRLLQVFKDSDITLVSCNSDMSDYSMTYQSWHSFLTDGLDDGEISVTNLNAIKWGVPEPLTDDNAPATAYPIQAWAGVLRGTVEAIAYHAQVPHAIAGYVLLGALSTMIQGRVNAPYVDGVKFMPVSLFLLSQYPSGEGKTLANGIAYQSIANWQYQLDEFYKQDIREWKAQKASTKRAELEKFLIDNPEPTQKTLFMRSGTLQGILDNMLMNNQKDITWVTADCGQFFGGHSMKSENMMFLISCLSDIWSTGEFDRILSPRAKNAIDEIRAYGVRFTVDLAGQYEVINPAITDPLMNNQGFLPRFLFTAPDIVDRVYNTPERMNSHSDQDPRLVAYWQRCNELLDPLPNPNYAESLAHLMNHERLNMTFENQHARQALADYQQSAQDRKAKGKALENYHAYANRLAENASRIASLMAFFEGRTALTVDDIERASLLTEYSIKERMRYDTTPQAGKNDRQKMMDWLLKQCKSMGENKILYSDTQSRINPKHLRKKADFELLVTVLTDKHYLRVFCEKNTRYIELNPVLLK